MESRDAFISLSGAAWARPKSAIRELISLGGLITTRIIRYRPRAAPSIQKRVLSHDLYISTLPGSTILGAMMSEIPQEKSCPVDTFPRDPMHPEGLHDIRSSSNCSELLCQGPRHSSTPGGSVKWGPEDRSAAIKIVEATRAKEMM